MKLYSLLRCIMHMSLLPIQPAHGFSMNMQELPVHFQHSLSAYLLQPGTGCLHSPVLPPAYSARIHKHCRLHLYRSSSRCLLCCQPKPEAPLRLTLSAQHCCMPSAGSRALNQRSSGLRSHCRKHRLPHPMPSDKHSCCLLSMYPLPPVPGLLPERSCQLLPRVLRIQ